MQPVNRPEIKRRKTAVDASHPHRHRSNESAEQLGSVPDGGNELPRPIKHLMAFIFYIRGCGSVFTGL